MSERALKIVVAGASGTGKSCLVSRLQSGAFKAKHVPTMGVEVHFVRVQTSRGVFHLKLWDLAGSPALRGLGTAYYAGMDGLIAVYDVIAPDTLAAAEDIIRGVRHAVLCGNRVDLRKQGDAELAPSSTDFLHCEVSAKSCQNLWQPILLLLRMITGDPHLQFSA